MNTLAQFMEAMKAGVLRPHQTKHLEDALSSKQHLHLGARQSVGKSFTLALLACVCACGYKRGSVCVPAADVNIISKDSHTAQDLIRKVKRHLTTMERRAGLRLMDPKLGSLSRIALINGRYITAFSSNPDGVQGMTGHCIVDEWSKGDVDPEELLAQAASITASNPGYKVMLASNADYELSFIHKFIESPDAEWTVRRRNMTIQVTTINDVFPDGLPPHIQAIRDIMHPDKWARFFLCRFIGSDNPAFISEHLNAAAETRTIDPDCVFVAGLDIGFTNNPTGWVVCAISRGRVHVVKAVHMHKPTPEQIKETVKRDVETFGIGRVWIDCGSVGWQTGNELIAELGEHRASRVTVSEKSRNNAHGVAFQLFATGAVHGITGVLRDDLSAMRLRNGETLEVPKYPGPDGCEIHCDAGEAFLYVMNDPALSEAGSRFDAPEGAVFSVQQSAGGRSALSML